MSQTLKLVRLKTWFIPADRESYQLLVDLGFPTTKIREESRGPLSLILKKKQIDVSVVKFKDIRDKFFNAVADAWLKHPGRLATVGVTSLTLETKKKSALDKAMKSLPKYKSKIEQWAERWGMHVTMTESELRGMLKLRIDFSVSERAPVIRLKSSVTDEPQQILEFGNHRLLVSTSSQFFHWRLEAKAGTAWKHVTGSKSLLTEMTDPTKFIGSLLTAYNA